MHYIDSSHKGGRIQAPGTRRWKIVSMHVFPLPDEHTAISELAASEGDEELQVALHAWSEYGDEERAYGIQGPLLNYHNHVTL